MKTKGLHRSPNGCKMRVKATGVRSFLREATPLLPLETRRARALTSIRMPS